MMRAKNHLMIGFAVVLAMSACNKAKSPDAAANDIAAAQQSAAREVADARRDRQQDMSSDSYDVAVARADGEHKVAMQKCDVLEGHDQKACKDQADADYEAAKANAKAAKVSQQP
jgi:hypothetical protein